MELQIIFSNPSYKVELKNKVTFLYSSYLYRMMQSVYLLSVSTKFAASQTNFPVNTPWE